MCFTHLRQSACVNPAHLIHGTKGDNIQQSYDRGRRPHINVGYLNSGSGNGMSKLTEVEVIEIKKLVLSLDDVTVANMYGVSVSTIYRIRLGYSWKHIA